MASAQVGGPDHVREPDRSDEERHAEVMECLSWIADRLDAMDARQSCIRCTTPPPPPPRWHGDLWSRDSRPPHTCGRSGGTR